MTAPFRIKRPAPGGARGASDHFKDYLERLLKMIPGEVVGLYMIGSGFIQQHAAGLIAWSAVCLVMVIVVRIYGTSDLANGVKPQSFPVFVSAVAFVIWIYWLGEPYRELGIYYPSLASLAVLFWSFTVPIFYKGDQ
jgi:hypothetical protein